MKHQEDSTELSPRADPDVVFGDSCRKDVLRALPDAANPSLPPVIPEISCGIKDFTECTPSAKSLLICAQIMNYQHEKKKKESCVAHQELVRTFPLDFHRRSFISSFAHPFLGQFLTPLLCRKGPSLVLPAQNSSEFIGDAVHIPWGSAWVKIGTYKWNIHMN